MEVETVVSNPTKAEASRHIFSLTGFVVRAAPHPPAANRSTFSTIGCYLEVVVFQRVVERERVHGFCSEQSPDPLAALRRPFYLF